MVDTVTISQLGYDVNAAIHRITVQPVINDTPDEDGWDLRLLSGETSSSGYSSGGVFVAGSDTPLGGGTAGAVSISGGSGVDGNGGGISISAGRSTDGNGGNLSIEAGGSDNGNKGNVSIVAPGNITLTATANLKIVSLPTADPGIAGAIYSDGAPSAGVPKALMISGG